MIASPQLPRCRSLFVALALGALAGTSACSGPESDETGSAGQPVVYGDDDRQDVFAFSDQAWAAQAAGFAAAMIPTSDIDASDPDDVQLPPETLADIGICPDERFADQPVAGFCSGTLIGPDLLLTAGHCIDSSDCGSFSFVFDYTMTDAATLQTITVDDVYACSDVLVNLVDDADYAVVRLDREVVGRTPAVVNAAPVALPDDQPLVINGFPTGLPLKIDDGANVRDARAGTLDFFVANLDTFGGNSGSGVFDDTSKQLVGILVRGEVDYVFDPQAGCDRVNVCPNDGCSGEDSTYAFRALEALCASGEAAPGLCPCGDGTCDAAGGETTATCPADCGTECGDGVCNGDETTESCIEDCPPEPTCELPIEVVLQATQTLTGDTTGAANDEAGSCVGDDAPDHVYALTLNADATVDAVVGGYDTGLYLRSTCDDPDSELACNDDISFPGNLGSQVTEALTAGQYFLVVDAFGSNSGEYTLTIDVSCADPTDTDGDGTADCMDGCAADPDKTEPGVCGCGVADTDTDTDGTADCVDACADDPGKTEPGTCGCGVADTDTDGDTAADCVDPCPDDPEDQCDDGDDAGDDEGDDAGDDEGDDAGDDEGDDAGDDEGDDAGDDEGDDSGSDDSSGDDSSGDDSSGDDSSDDDDGGCNASGGRGGAPGALILAFALLGLRRRRLTRR